MATAAELSVILTQIETRLRSMSIEAQDFGCSKVKNWVWTGPPDEEPKGGLIGLSDQTKSKTDGYEFKDSEVFLVASLIDDYADEIAGLISILEKGGG
jgi:hypothetical protein